MKRVNGIRGVAATLSVAIASVMAPQAQATTMAQAILDIDNFLFTDLTNGGVVTAFTGGDDIAVLVGSNNGETSASLTGFASVGSGSLNVAVGAPLGDAFSCTGTSCPIITNNDFTIKAAPPTGHAASSDLLTSGLALDFGGGTTGVHAQTRADVWLLGEAIGSADTNTGATATLMFSTLTDIDIGISFDAKAYLSAFSSAGQVFDSNSQAGLNWSISLTDVITGTPVFSWAPDGLAGGILGGTELADPFSLNTSRARNAPFNGESCYPNCGVFNSGVFSASTTLLGGTLYSLSINQLVTADAKQVPTPGGLALMGIGLLAAGVVSRKRLSA